MSNKGTNNPKNRISYGQYKTADLFTFLLIMAICEAVNVYAVKSWFSSQQFTVSIMLLVSLIVIIRWGWWGLMYPVADGLLYCAICGITDPYMYIVYAVGNAFVIFVWFLFKLISKEKIVSAWWWTLLYAVIAYVLFILGRTVMYMICYPGVYSFLTILGNEAGGELLNLTFAIMGLLILRKFDGMLVDQKTYLLKVTTERDTIKPAQSDYQWDGYTELDEEDLKSLAAMDEYDQKVTFNRSSLKALKEQSETQFSDEDDLSRLDEQ